MGIKWQDVKVGSSVLTNNIYIGKVKKEKSGFEIWTDRSGDMTNQFIGAVKEHLKLRCEREEEYKDGITLTFKDGSELKYIPSKVSEEEVKE